MTLQCNFLSPYGNHHCPVVYPSPKTFFEIYGPVITASVVIFLFIVERFYAAWLRKRDRRKDWYLKVLVEPNLKLINKFFEDCIESLQKSMDDLKSSDSQTHQEFKKTRAKSVFDFQDIKRKFEFEFLYLVKPFDYKLSEALNNVILKMEDFFTSTIGSEDYSSFENANLARTLQQHKSEFYQFLYTPLSRSNKLLDWFERQFATKG
jgi:hypothetical protein